MRLIGFIFCITLFLCTCTYDGIESDNENKSNIDAENLVLRSSYEFGNGTIPRNVLESYLSRSITQSEFLHGPGFYDELHYHNKDDDTRMLKNIGAKFIGRSIFSWGAEDMFNNPAFLASAEQKIQEMHQYDPDVIFQAAIFEIVTTKVNSVPIPAWVFEEFGLPVDERNFSYSDMLNQNGQFVDHWGPGASVPDISRLETRMFFYFMARKYMEIGIEAIHFGQAELMAMTDKNNNYAAWNDLLSRVRETALTVARRGTILCDAHLPSGGIVVNGKLLFDFVSFPMRLKEICESPQEAEFKKYYLDAIYGRTKGGTTPSGWYCEKGPYIVEFDNFGISDYPGTCNLTDYFVWGYDEITWFALQPEDYRKEFLKYAHDWVRIVDPNGYVEMPGSRIITTETSYSYYRANTNSTTCPEGMNMEEAIKTIWSSPLVDTVTNLIIKGIDITDYELNVLSSKIVCVRDTIILENTNVTTSDDFFDKVKCNGSIILRNNPNLSNPNGFKNYKRIYGDLIIENCPNLYYWPSSDGTAGFSGIERIDGSFVINPATKMSDGGGGFAQLSYVGGDFILIGDRTAGEIWNLATWYVWGGGIKHIGGDLIFKNHYKVNGLDGFQAVEYIGGDIYIMDNGGPDGYIPIQTQVNQIGFCLVKIWINNGVIKKQNPIIQLRQSANSPFIDISTLEPCSNMANFITQNVPATMITGESYDVSLTFKNSSATTWSSEGEYKLGSQNPHDNMIWGTNRIYLGESEYITGGGQKTFSFNVTAPSTEGSYNFQWRMVQDGVEWFGDWSSNISIHVYSPFLDHCDVLDGWNSYNQININTIDKKESTGCIESSGNGIIEFEKAFSPFNAYAYVSEDDGILRFWYYVSDITKLNGENQIELGSGGCADIEEYNWPIGTLTNGWNLISKKFSDAGVTNGTPDLNALNWFRIYHYKSGTVTTRIDGIQIIKE